MDIVAVIGAGQNTGKTSAVESLVKEFKSRGMKVGTIKQIHEHNFFFDKKGKDSWRHAEAGADIVIAASPNEVVAIKRLNSRSRFEEALKILKGEGLDIIVIEGHPGIKVPMIYAMRDEKKVDEKPVDENVVAIVSLSPPVIHSDTLPVLHIENEISQIADLLLGTL